MQATNNGWREHIHILRSSELVTIYVAS